MQKLRDDADGHLFTHFFRGDRFEVPESMACLTYTDTGVQQSFLIVERRGRTPLNYLLVASFLSRLLPSSKDAPVLSRGFHARATRTGPCALHNNSGSLNGTRTAWENHRNMIMTSVVPHEWINVTDTVEPDREKMQIILANGALFPHISSSHDASYSWRAWRPVAICILETPACAFLPMYRSACSTCRFHDRMVHNKKEMLDLFSNPVPEPCCHHRSF